SLTIETVDTHLEETIASANLCSMHMQLSRLKNSSTILKDAILTVIPSQYSKVNFKFVRSLPSTDSDSQQSSKQTKLN
ncbi:unnamed protein product, partial [Sphagnum jensenii]